MRDRLIWWLATGFGAGHLPKAPGLFGSLVGLLWWWVARDQLWLTLAGIAIAVWVCGQAARQASLPDPTPVVLDEICAVPVALWGAMEFWDGCVAFVLFRLLDVWKPTPIRQLQRLPGGWGIVVDDVVAAGLAALITHGLRWATLTIR
ncbi:MAG: phosphatidylglycerophosphatase A [Verrucomicrobiae bacterium]|nr:phosphatidylglycerophosphatase A [Verrucomicrobiae bacterium]MCX7914752.1 phosphatidylglycerophosphatase A [Verrucomicrobiae bacterium]MDW8344591.1 phosphatidylglycerophosphatase A [Verrucomicrobiae bacterium]